MPPLPIDAVVIEARARGLRIQRVFHLHGRVGILDSRCLLIEEKPCQVLRTRNHISNPASPQAVSIPLHVPRSDWADFIIYVVRPRRDDGFGYYVVPRGALSKNTSFASESLESYRDAWDSLRHLVDPKLTERRFTVLNWQVGAVVRSATEAGLDVVLIRGRKRWPIFLQTRVLIAGRRCALHSFSRVSNNPNQRNFNYVALRALKENWPEFQLYVLRQENEYLTYIIPRDAVKKDTSLSTENPRLLFYRNNWNLLSESAASSLSCEWARPKITRSPREVPASLRETILEVEKRGLSFELVSSRRGEKRLHISTKRCQVMEATPVTKMVGSMGRSYIPLNLPRSDWAQFLIFYVRTKGAPEPVFYVLPRIKLGKRTELAPTSNWLREYKQAWHLLQC
jgi:hypothetical protein